MQDSLWVAEDIDGVFNQDPQRVYFARPGCREMVRRKG